MSTYNVSVNEYGGGEVQSIKISSNSPGFIEGFKIGLESKLDPDKYYVVIEVVEWDPDDEEEPEDEDNYV